MSIGTMKQVVLEQWTQPKDGSGNIVDTKTHSYKIWADVSRSSGSRVFDTQTKMDSQYKFRAYSRTAFDITALWKIVYDGKRLTVQSIDKEKENNFYWIIRADANSTK